MSEQVSIIVPDIGDYADVPVVEIMVKEGDSVIKDQSLISIESDKAVLEIPAPHDGIIVSITVSEGDTLSAGNSIGTMEISGKNEESSSEQINEDGNTAEDSEKDRVGNEKQEETSPHNGNRNTNPEKKSPQVHASPSVRLIAREFNVDLSTVQGSGPKGRITKDDIRSMIRGRGGSTSYGEHIQVDPEQFKKFGHIEIQDINRIKKKSAPRLSASWQQIPHVTHFAETDISDLEQFRKDTNNDLKDDGIKLTILAFALKAAVITLKKFPHFNTSFMPSEKKIVLKKYYNIGFAADTPEGLMVPVVKNADNKGLIEIGKEIISLSTAARNGSISPEDLKGATFTISSLGSIGGTNFTPIINPPEAAILGLAQAAYKPVYNEVSRQFDPRYILPFSLSYDHRVVDGAEGARFCAHFARMLGDTRNLIL